jgi:hypothetical protein
LVGQTIALGLNIRGDIGLGSLTLIGNQLTTAKSTSCANGNPIPGTERSFCIPQNVWNYLSAPKSVNQLYALANQALGGNTPSGLSISDINAAVDAINRAFDQCRVLVAFGTCSNQRSIETSEAPFSETNPDYKTIEQTATLKAYPNPMGENGTIEIVSTISDNMILQIFSGRGELINTLWNGRIEADEKRTVSFQTSDLASGIYIVKLTMGMDIQYETIIVNR